MEFYQLQCFIAVVEEGGFNKAAVQLHMSQPALSYQIKQLEEQLSTSMFHRGHRGILPTEAGRILFEHAKRILISVNRAKQVIQELSDEIAGEVRIGTVNSIDIYFLPQILQYINSKYDRVKTNIQFRQSAEITNFILSNKIDMALLANPRFDRRLNYEVIFKERVSLVCGRSCSLYGKKRVKPHELAEHSFITLSPETPTGQIINDYIVQHDLPVNPVICADNTETIKTMVEEGLGIAFLPDMVTSHETGRNGEPSGLLSRLQVGPTLIREIVLVSLKNYEMSKANQVFIDELREHGNRWKSSLRKG